MPKYLIMHDAGYGKDYRVAEFDSDEEAQKAAYEDWRETAENNAEYNAELLTQELAEEYGVEDEL